MDVWVSYAVALGILLLIIKFFSLSFSLLWNGIIGGITLWVVNLLGAVLAFHINITVISALIAGFFGVPGVVVLILWEIIK